MPECIMQRLKDWDGQEIVLWRARHGEDAPEGYWWVEYADGRIELEAEIGFNGDRLRQMESWQRWADENI